MRRAAMVVASTALGLVVCGSTLAMAIHVNPDAEGDHNQAAKAPPLSIPSGVMEANILTKANPIYPVAAKKAKIQGRVVLQAVIGKDGKIENLRVVSGPKQLQQSALDAVRQWTYKPYLLNGYPVELETTINVVYSLAG
jgi:TonB family protein